MAEPADNNTDNRLWRLEQGHADIFRRLDKIETRLEQAESRQGDRAWRLESVEYRLGEIAKKIDEAWKKLDELEKRPPVVVTGAMGDSTVRVIIYGLIAGVVALAGGQAINLTGLLK